MWFGAVLILLCSQQVTRMVLQRSKTLEVAPLQIPYYVLVSFKLKYLNSRPPPMLKKLLHPRLYETFKDAKKVGEPKNPFTFAPPLRWLKFDSRSTWWWSFAPVASFLTELWMRCKCKKKEVNMYPIHLSACSNFKHLLLWIDFCLLSTFFLKFLLLKPNPAKARRRADLTSSMPPSVTAGCLHFRGFWKQRSHLEDALYIHSKYMFISYSIGMVSIATTYWNVPKTVIHHSISYWHFFRCSCLLEPTASKPTAFPGTSARSCRPSAIFMHIGGVSLWFRTPPAFTGKNCHCFFWKPEENCTRIYQDSFDTLKSIFLVLNAG